jgi:hypothetical protein
MGGEIEAEVRAFAPILRHLLAPLILPAPSSRVPYLVAFLSLFIPVFWQCPPIMLGKPG